MRNSTAQPPSQVTRQTRFRRAGCTDTGTTCRGRGAGGRCWQVALEGEPLLWNPIVISVICNGATAYTRQPTQGNFGIILAPTATEPDVKRLMRASSRAARCRRTLPDFTPARSRSPSTICGTNRPGNNYSFARGRTSRATALSTTLNRLRWRREAFDKARTELMTRRRTRRSAIWRSGAGVSGVCRGLVRVGDHAEAGNSGDARDRLPSGGADPQFVLPYEQLAGSTRRGRVQDVVDNTNHTLMVRRTIQRGIRVVDHVLHFCPARRAPPVARRHTNCGSAATALANDPRIA